MTDRIERNDPAASNQADDATTSELAAEDVSVGFDGSWILRNIDVDIRGGQTVAVIGESGCGKTVFMKTLVGLIRPTRGVIRVDDGVVASMNVKQMRSFRRRFGFVFQNAALFDSLSIFDNVAFPVIQNETTRGDELTRRVHQHLAEVGLSPDVLNKFPAELSGGMRKRVGLARALILNPRVIVYDEPTTGLDPIMSDVINELMLDVRRRYPVTSIIVTHDMHTVRKVADRVLMFFPRRRLGDPDEPQILFDGPPGDLDHAEDARVRQFVRGEAGARLSEMASGWDESLLTVGAKPRRRSNG